MNEVIVNGTHIMLGEENRVTLDELHNINSEGLKKVLALDANIHTSDGTYFTLDVVKGFKLSLHLTLGLNDSCTLVPRIGLEDWRKFTISYVELSMLHETMKTLLEKEGFTVETHWDEPSIYITSFTHLTLQVDSASQFKKDLDGIYNLVYSLGRRIYLIAIEKHMEILEEMKLNLWKVKSDNNHGNAGEFYNPTTFHSFIKTLNTLEWSDSEEQ